MNTNNPTLQEIILADAQFVKNSGFYIRVNKMAPYVAIRCKADFEQDEYLQGHTAEAYLDRAYDLWQQVPDLTLMDVYLHLAKQYVENLM